MWLLLALAAALGATAADVLTKRAAQDLPDHAAALARWLYALPLLALALPLVPLPPLTGRLVLTMLLLAPLEIGALVLYVRAISRSPLSLSAPFLAFTPALLLGTGALFLGEHVPPLGVVGVILVTLGAYAMNVGDLRRGLLAPLRALWRDPGPRLVLGAACLYAFTAALSKPVVVALGPVGFGAFYLALLTAIFLPLLVVLGRPVRPVFVGWRKLFPIGLVIGAATLAQFAAYTLAPVAYAIAVKRTSMVLSVVAGYLFFHERKIAERLIGASLMVVGVGLIALSR
jgi:drug/metabolite transporter (DMT)-like permease